MEARVVEPLRPQTRKRKRDLVAASVFRLVHPLVSRFEKLFGRMLFVRCHIHREVRDADAHCDVDSGRCGVRHQRGESASAIRAQRARASSIDASLLRSSNAMQNSSPPLRPAKPCACSAVCAKIAASRRSSSSPDGCPCVSFQVLIRDSYSRLAPLRFLRAWRKHLRHLSNKYDCLGWRYFVNEGAGRMPYTAWS
jgi:hypothetical protein